MGNAHMEPKHFKRGFPQLDIVNIEQNIKKINKKMKILPPKEIICKKWGINLFKLVFATDEVFQVYSFND